MTLPPKGHKLPGVKVKWSLSRAQDLEADVGEGDKTDATPLGGDFTDAAGDSTFRVAPVIEPLCRKSAEDCGKGKETGRINVATAEVDINHVNAAQYNHLSDVDKLLTTLGVIWSLVDAPGTIIAILLKVAKSIGAPRGEGRVTVTRHEKPDYRYSTSSSGITTSLLKCDGIEGPWQLVIDGRSSGFKVKGNVQFTIPQGQLEGPVSGGVSFDYGGGFGKTSLKVTVSGVVKVVNPDSDSPKLDLSGVKQSGSAGVSIGNTTGGFSLSGDSGGAPMTLTSGQFCSKK
jgi:hypothetical protein